MLSKPISDLILIRHAQSKFNLGFRNYLKQHNLDLSWDECIQLDDFNKKIVQFLNKEYSNAKEQENSSRINKLIQALQTCNEIFGGRNVKIQVHPLLAEVFRYACDISNHMKEKEHEFKQFDFTHMSDKSQLWYLEHLSKQIKEACLKHLPKEGQANSQEKQERILSLISQKIVYQTPQQLRQRTWKVKSLLKCYQQKYKKIAVVSHFYLIGTLIAKQFNEQGEVIEFQQIYNALPVHKNIDELLSTK